MTETSETSQYPTNHTSDAPTEVLLEEGMLALLRGYAEDAEELTDAVSRVHTFEDEGVMTSDRGLLVTMTDGSEYQVTIVQRRQAR